MNQPDKLIKMKNELLDTVTSKIDSDTYTKLFYSDFERFDITSYNNFLIFESVKNRREGEIINKVDKVRNEVFDEMVNKVLSDIWNKVALHSFTSFTIPDEISLSVKNKIKQ